MKTGVLLVNLGTPDAPETRAVRRYLREFLSDPRVIDINAVGRALLLNLIVLPFRSSASAEAYKKVWTEAGSPLLVHGEALRDAVRERLTGHPTVLAMRYGNPSIASGLEELRTAGCDRVVVLPLYPQYASSSTGSTVEKVYAEAGRLWNTPFLSIVPAFYDDPGYLDVGAELGRPILADLIGRPVPAPTAEDAPVADRTLPPDTLVLFSFHGLPERHCEKSDPTGAHCFVRDDCCAAIVDANRSCYRAQCFATARGLTRRLGLGKEDAITCFQSRFGKAVWIRPYTDILLEELPRRGIKRVVVFCPAFVSDCLETVEEIGIRAVEDFRAAGGEELRLVPSLNADPRWADAVSRMVRRSGALEDDAG